MSFVTRISASKVWLKRSAPNFANWQEPVGTARSNSWHLLRQPSHLTNNAATTAAGVRFLSSNYHGFRNPGARISETSVFMQDGAKISEVPLIVKKVNDIFELYRR